MLKVKILKARKLLLNNIELKLFSLFLSVIIWYFVIGQEVKESVFYIPIEYVNLPSSLEIVGEFRNVFEVSVKGPSTFLKRLTPQDIKITIDLSNAQKGSKTFYQKDFNIDTPFGVTITKIYPPAVKLEFDRLIKKEVPVKLNLKGNCGYGYELKSYSIEPKLILIEGIQEIVEKLEYIETDPVDINGLTKDKDIIISLSGEILGLRLLQSTSVKVHLNVGEIILKKILKGIKLEANDKKRVITYSQNKVDIEIMGPMKLIDNINQEEFYAYIDIKNYKSGVYTLPIEIKYPEELKEHIKITNIDPNEITLNIK